MEKQEKIEETQSTEQEKPLNRLSVRLNEKHGKNISIRLKDEEKKYFDGLASSLGMTRTEMIKRAVRAYDKQLKDGNSSVVNAAQDLMAVKTGSTDFNNVINHRLSKRIYKKGLSVLDAEGNTITHIKDLHGLMEFVDKNVFKNG